MAEANIVARDQQVRWIEPQTATDQRVPSAEELRASSNLHQSNLAASHRLERPAGLRNRPNFTGTAKTVTIPANTLVHAPGHPAVRELTSANTITLPNLADTVSTVSRYDRIYLAVMGVEFNATHDSNINQTFQWTQGQSTQTFTKENTRRVRSVWMFVHATTTITATDLANALPTNKQFTVSKAVTGSALGSYRIYPLDSALASGAVHTVMTDSIELVDLCRVWRSQNFNQTGYVWGRNGETNITTEFHVQPSYRYVGPGWENLTERCQETLQRILSGASLPESPGRDYAVYNLINGQYGANLDNPGIATASPNGSTAIANDQRVSITNQAITQKTYCAAVVTVNSGGFAQGSVPFQVNSPTGSIFSQDESDHKVYTANGTDVTASGRLTGLGGNGALIWTANNAQVVAPGDTIYIVPGIFYPAGSGFPNSGTIDAVYVNGATINAANVRDGADDLAAYAAPAAGDSYFVIVGRDRGAVHYVYERFSVTSDGSGVVRIPANTNGVIAFISGTNAPTGRIDRPVITGLNASTAYQILCYRPFKASETWQFRWNVPRYAGSGERTFIDGSTIASEPIFLGHTQGGGNSEFLAEGGLQYEPIAFRLPANTNGSAVPAYRANYKMQFQGEPDLGYTSIRMLDLHGATGLTAPLPGIRITAPAAILSQSKGIAARLLDSGGRTLGIRKLPIVCNQIYQLVSAFLVEKAGEYRLVVCANNGGDTTKPVPQGYDTDATYYGAIDTFRLY